MADGQDDARKEKKNMRNEAGGRQSAGSSSDFKGVIFTPTDEPYLGRSSVFHFDQLISAVLETNLQVAPLTRKP